MNLYITEDCLGISLEMECLNERLTLLKELVHSG